MAFSFARVERTLLSAAFDLAVDLDLVYVPIAKSFAAGGRWQRWYSRNLRGIAALHIFKQS
jgi:hypothetical protein